MCSSKKKKTSPQKGLEIPGGAGGILKGPKIWVQLMYEAWLEFPESGGGGGGGSKEKLLLWRRYG